LGHAGAEVHTPPVALQVDYYFVFRANFGQNFPFELADLFEGFRFIVAIYVVDIRISLHSARESARHDEIDPSVGEARAQLSEQGCRENYVAHRAEPNQKDFFYILFF
jgi:hypothetical protein